MPMACQERSKTLEFRGQRTDLIGRDRRNEHRSHAADLRANRQTDSGHSHMSATIHRTREKEPKLEQCANLQANQLTYIKWLGVGSGFGAATLQGRERRS